MPSLPFIRVAAGVIVNAQKEILVALRPAHVPYSGYWEFPGGKIDPGETKEQALVRELHEEIGIHVVSAQHFLQVHHTYPEKQLELDAFWVTEFQGLPEGKEGQDLQWVKSAALTTLQFLPANSAIIAAIQSHL